MKGLYFQDMVKFLYIYEIDLLLHLMLDYKVVNELLQRCQLLLIDQLKLVAEIIKVFEASIQMGFFSKRYNVLEVGVVNMSVP